MRTLKEYKNSGFSMVELMVSLGLVGIVAFAGSQVASIYLRSSVSDDLKSFESTVRNKLKNQKYCQHSFSGKSFSIHNTRNVMETSEQITLRDQANNLFIKTDPAHPQHGLKYGKSLTNIDISVVGYSHLKDISPSSFSPAKKVGVLNLKANMKEKVFSSGKITFKEVPTMSFSVPVTLVLQSGQYTVEKCANINEKTGVEKVVQHLNDNAPEAINLPGCPPGHLKISDPITGSANCITPSNLRKKKVCEQMGGTYNSSGGCAALTHWNKTQCVSGTKIGSINPNGTYNCI